MSLIYKKSLFIFLILFAISNPAFAVLSCSVTTSSGCTDVKVLRMSSSTNAHAELPDQSNPNYDNNVVCCSGIVSTSCSGAYATVVKLYNVTNSQVETFDNNNFSYSACISNVAGTVTIGYQDDNCTGYDTALFSMTASTSATVGDVNAYTKKVCGSASDPVPQEISFSISTTTVYFGELSHVLTHYASSTNVLGDTQEVEAHNLVINTNASNGYVLTVKGSTLTSQENSLNTINALASNTAPNTGVEQFGIKVIATGGVGTTTSPYIGSGFAYAGTVTTSSEIAHATTGDNATTTYSIRYMANIGALTEAGNYFTNLTYIATPSF